MRVFSVSWVVFALICSLPSSAGAGSFELVEKVISVPASRVLVNVGQIRYTATSTVSGNWMAAVASRALQATLPVELSIRDQDGGKVTYRYQFRVQKVMQSPESSGSDPVTAREIDLMRPDIESMRESLLGQAKGLIEQNGTKEVTIRILPDRFEFDSAK